MKQVLVTGGFGFLGGHLVEELLLEPNNLVHVVDNLSTSPLPHQKFLEEIGNPKNLTYDICDVQKFCKLNLNNHIDEIYHLASIVGPAGVIPKMGWIIPSIVEDTNCLVRLAQYHNARLLDVSTSEVYGGGEKGLCSEQMPKLVSSKPSARLEYGVGKMAAEITLQNLSQVDALDVVIVRPFNIAGPRQSGKGGLRIASFCEPGAVQPRFNSIWGWKADS